MTQPIRKKLIEVSIPLEAINVASAREKSIRHGHPSTLHLWWARRPLAACRAVLFAQLVDDPSSWPDRFPTEEAQDVERRRLHRIIEAMVPWEASNDEAILDATRWEIARSVAWGLGEEPPARDDGLAILDYLQAKAPPVYDPFSGGGSIPLEAQRLGLRAYGSDLNPVAVLIGKALVEIPPRFANRLPVNPMSRAEAVNGQLRAWKGAQGLAEDILYYGRLMRDEAEKRIGYLYPKAELPDGSERSVIAWVWARTVRSPDPAAKAVMVPLASSFLLSAKEGKKTWVEPVIDANKSEGWYFKVRTGLLSKHDEDRLKKGTKTSRGTNFECLLTGSAITPDYVRSEGLNKRIGARLMAVVAEGTRSRIYLTPTPQHETAATLATPGDISGIDVDMPDNPRWFSPPGYGMRTFSSLFTQRQLTALMCFSELVNLVRDKVYSDAISANLLDDGEPLSKGGDAAAGYADAIATYLSLSVGKAADYWSTICFWHSGAAHQKIVNTFGRQAIPMTWDFAEGNPFSVSSGNYMRFVELIARVCEMAVPAVGESNVSNINACEISHKSDVVISSDPPYYDNIGYSDLSDFFYIWLKQSGGRIWPELFRRLLTPKADELIATPHRHGGKAQAETFFMEGMKIALARMAIASNRTEPLAIYYAFKQSEVSKGDVTSAGWASFLQAVTDAGLSVDGTWPIRMEYTTTLKSSVNALSSSVVLVCRQRPKSAETITRDDLIRALKKEMPAAIDSIRKAGVGPVDMQQSVIGPGMGIFSRYQKIIEDDDTAMSVKTALGVINRVWEEIENELDQVFDPETQVALAWYATYGFDARASGELITLTTAKNTSDRALFDSDVFEDMRGKTRLTPRDKLPPDWSPASDKTLTIWECVQHTARVLNAPNGGGEKAATLVAQMGPKAEEARALAYRLFEIATAKGWAAEALVYNELAQEWTKLEDRAATLGDARGGSSQLALL